MTDVQFGRLQELPLRDAWKHEALDFTPWLADNIDHLSEAIGIPLELTGTEVAVESFSADILARNPMDDTAVLIENQLATTDHSHLGQIMTYLAGLKAQTVVWIAPDFREPHLTAIDWLNENTSDGFSFFAVKARVVRIGDSPYAPIFEVVKKPDAWERALAEKRRESTSNRDALSDTRLAFWTHYTNLHTAAAADGIKPIRGWNVYFPMCDGSIQISVWIGDKTAGIYVRGGWGDRKNEASDLLAPHIKRLAKALGADTYSSNKNGHVFGERFPKSYKDQGNWDDIIDWMEDHRTAYIAAISDAIGTEQ